MMRSGRSRNAQIDYERVSVMEIVKEVRMLRTVAITAMIALAVPTLAMAQGHEEHHPGARPPAGAPRGPHPGGPVGPHPSGPVGPHPGGPVGPHPGGPVGQVMYHGRPFSPIHVAPFVYPPGFGYRRWIVGAALPPLFLVPAYYYAGWAAFGLAPPQPGYQWVRYGPDLLLVNVSNGQVVDTVYGAFY